MTKNQTTKKPYAERVAEEIIKALETDLPKWRKSWKAVIGNRPCNGKSKHQYRGINAYLAAQRMQDNGYIDPRFYTFKQVQEAGGRIKKGEHGLGVQYWLWNSGKVVLGTDADGNEITKKIKPFSIIYSTVFNAEQCEGLPAYKTDIPAETWQPLERAEAIVKAAGVAVKHDQGDRAYYAPTFDTIHIPPRGAFKSAEAYYGVLLHELSHATGHASRCNRDFGGRFGTPQYAAEELRAEICCLMLCATLGINPPEQDAQHKAYVKSWLKKLHDDPKEIFKAANDAEAGLNWLLEAEANAAPKAAATKTEEPHPVAAYGVPEGNEPAAFTPYMESLF